MYVLKFSINWELKQTQANENSLLSLLPTLPLFRCLLRENIAKSRFLYLWYAHGQKLNLSAQAQSLYRGPRPLSGVGAEGRTIINHKKGQVHTGQVSWPEELSVRGQAACWRRGPSEGLFYCLLDSCPLWTLKSPPPTHYSHGPQGGAYIILLPSRDAAPFST